MRLYKKIAITVVVILLLTVCKTQLNKTQTLYLKVNGSCGMCEARIEKAGYMKDVAVVDWDMNTKIAKITFDASKTNKEEISRKIALAGYDNESFLATDESYSSLPGCCQYLRESAVLNSDDNKNKKNQDHSGHDHSGHNHGEGNSDSTKPQDNSHEHSNMASKTETDDMVADGLNLIFLNYFKIKEALVNSDLNTTRNYGGSLYRAINKVDSLESNVEVLWMKKKEEIKSDAVGIANAKDIKEQRLFLNRLSDNIYELMKVSKHKTSVYYQHCPMANQGKGGNWLSKEKAIKNPYYGSQMLDCGKTIEIIK
jgi:copper chaperone CopZ